MADLIAVNKADGSNKLRAEGTRVLLQNALRLFPQKPSHWIPLVQTCSALTDSGILDLWKIIKDYVKVTGESGFFEEHRKQQAVIRMHSTILDYLNSSFYNLDDVKMLLPEMEQKLHDGAITSYNAALKLLEKYFKRCH